MHLKSEGKRRLRVGRREERGERGERDKGEKGRSVSIRGVLFFTSLYDRRFESHSRNIEAQSVYCIEKVKDAAAFYGSPPYSPEAKAPRRDSLVSYDQRPDARKPEGRRRKGAMR